jgi:hypothetical protein
MATLNRIAEEKNKKNAKASGGMSAAVASTEKIRKWVRYLINLTLDLGRTCNPK